MKKIFSFLLTLTLALSLGSVSASAANPIVTADSSGSAEVFGTFQAGNPAATVYSIDVSWGAMEFTYTSASEGAWDPTTRTFSSVSPAKWTVNETDGDKVTVTNNSNAAINVGFIFSKAAAVPDVTGGFTIGSAGASGNFFTLATAVGTASSAAPSNFARFVPGGSMDAGTGVKIGSITVILG